MSTKTLTLIRGLPGSGKTTLATQLLLSDDTLPTSVAFHAEADSYFCWPDGVYRYDKSKVAAAHEWCRISTEVHMRNDENVVVSNTFTRLWEMRPYAELARKFGYKLLIIEVNGRWPNEHGVSDEHISLMAKRWEPLPMEFRLFGTFPPCWESN
jgi:predicted kinase